MAKNSSKKKWFALSMVGAALLFIPRRSSRQTMPPPDTRTKPSHKRLNNKCGVKTPS